MQNLKQPLEIDLLKKEWDSVKKVLDSKNEVLDAVLEHSLAGWYDYNLASDDLYLSPAFSKILGYDEDEFQNEDIQSIKRILHPDDLPKIIEAYFNHIKTKGKSKLDLQVRYIHKNGSIVWVYARAKVIEWNNAGDPVRLVGSNTDITHLKEAEADLHNVKQELEKITYRFKISTMVAKVGIWDWDIKNNVLIWDKQMYAIYGITEDTFEGAFEAWHNAIHPDERDMVNDSVNSSLMDSSKDWHCEFRIILPDGSIRYIKASGYVEFDNKSKPSRMIGTNWDITKEKEMEREKIRAKQLESQNKELEQFVYVASHDLQEPLHTISSYSEMLKLKCKGLLDAKSSRYFDYLIESSGRMNSLIKGLLDYSRLGRNQSLEAVSCESLINEIKKDFAGVIAEKNVKLKIGNLPVIDGNKIELRQLFQNLISNAIKFKKKESLTISIKSKRERNYWLFSVEDDGIGIDPKHFNKIFMIFQRLHTKSEIDGTGIGLSLCKKIVESQDGDIWVRSKPNEGSTFYFTIPDNE
ncbi:MAG: PAS domain-containing protein [Bacteroidia bacterium]|nr:PAS domain-containing protein [Bacteroidia bacterium]